jgi:hypothetical protein
VSGYLTMEWDRAGDAVLWVRLTCGCGNTWQVDGDQAWDRFCARVDAAHGLECVCGQVHVSRQERDILEGCRRG